MRKTVKLMKEIKEQNKWRDIPCSFEGPHEDVGMREPELGS